MKKCWNVLIVLFVLAALLFPDSGAAAADGYYQLTEVSQPAWDGTTANRLDTATADYDYTYGDDEPLSYNLPWTIPFYGRNYSSVTADTNGNVWFSAADAAYSFNLVNSGRGPVIAAWNNDLSSSYYGGVFIQHKTNPERVVVEWQAETYTEEGLYSPNNFAVVLYPDGTIRYDYKTFSTQSGYDAGSGISRGDGSATTDLTAQFGNVFGLAGRSFQFAPQSLYAVTVAKDGVGTGAIISNPPGISCGATCSGNFPQGTTVVLSATPGFGALFGSWSGETCTGTDPCTLTLDSAKSVTATFGETYAPAIAINSPSGTMANSRPVLDFAVSTGAAVVKVDGSVVDKVSGDLLDTLLDGPHVVSVEATNAAGHLGFAESSFIVDTTPPTTFTPTNGSSNVPVRISILVQFAEQIDPASVMASTALLASQVTPVPGDIRLADDRKSLIFKPQGKLAYATAYTFTLKAGVRDLLGNALSSDLTTTFSTPMADPDLVGYWPMDGNWNDYSGYGNEGTAYGSSAFTGGRVPGVSSANFVIDSQIFEGSGGFVETPVKFIDYVDNSFTMSFWAKPTATRETTLETNLGYYLGDGVQRFAIAPTNMYDLGYSGAIAGVSVGTNGISVFEETTMGGGGIESGYFPSLLVYDSPTPLTGWNHVAVVYNNKQPSLYLNGALVRTGQNSQQSQVFASATFAFGNERATGSYSGQLEGVAYHGRALTAQEIQALYQGQTQAIPEIAITSSGQAAKYTPGATGSATVSVTSTSGITRLYCSASGATTDGALSIDFEQPQTQTTAHLDFHVAESAGPYAPIVLSCVAQTADGVFGVGDLQLQAADLVPPTVVSSSPANDAIDFNAIMPIVIRFSEPMDRASIVSRDTFRFQRTDNGAWVTGMYALSTGKEAMMSLPSPALDAATSYTIRLSGLRDLAGNTLSDYTLQFTTGQQTSLVIENQGTPSSPYVLPSARYGTLTLNNSYVTASGGVTADTLTMDHSTLSLSSSASSPGNLGVAYGNMVLTNGSHANVSGTLYLSADLSLADSTMAVIGAGTASGSVLLSNSTIILKTQLQAAGDVTLQNNSVLTHYAATSTNTSKLDITAANMTIDATSKIDVSGLGYLGGFQPGNSSLRGRTLGNTATGGSSGGRGGSYGGVGGNGGGSDNANVAYGDVANPNELGSGGSGATYNNYYSVDEMPGSNGGGLVRLNVGALSLDGLISADGLMGVYYMYAVGGGSGGGIRIDARSVNGNGMISAKGGGTTSASAGGGGAGGGGGGGGRIAVYYDSLTLPVGNITACGGGISLTNDVSRNGGAGTVFLKNNSAGTLDLVINNGGTVTNNITPIWGGNFNSVSVNGEAIISGNYAVNGLTFYDNISQTFSNGLSLPGNTTFINSIITVNGAIDVSSLSLTGSNLTLDGSSITVAGTMNVTGALTLVNGSLLTHYGATTTATYDLKVTAALVSIDATSKIDASGKGYLGGSTGFTFGNTVAGGSTSYYGGSYGGLGGTFGSGSANVSYGNLQQPNDVGSGGGGFVNTRITPGGNGGGLVILTATSLDLAGNILANGGSAESVNGGGSGGGILLNIGTLTGSGTISATGGDSSGGAGGGGRIAIYYGINTLPITNILAMGGKSDDGSNPAHNGGAGTIYLKDNAKSNGDVVIDNGGTVTRNITLILGGSFNSFNIDGGAVFSGDYKLGQDTFYIKASQTFSSGLDLPGNLTFIDSIITVNGGIDASSLSLVGSNLTVEGEVILTGMLTLKDGSVLSHFAATPTETYKLDVAASSVNVDTSSKIDVSSKGYLGGWRGGNSTGTGMTYGNTTAGGSAFYSGGSYGGLGGYANGNVNSVYGDMQQPGEVGSGGGTPNGGTYPGGNGGGYIKVTAGAVILDGDLIADGGAVTAAGGGSGGGVLLNVGSLSGIGTISARGGSSAQLITDYGSGGGGRIAIYYDTNTLPTANVIASGGKSGNGSVAGHNGGAGTVYLKDNAKIKGDVIANNGGVTTSNVTTVAGSDYGQVRATGGAQIIVAGDISSDQDIVFIGSNVTFNGAMAAPGNLTLDGSSVTAVGAVNVTGVLTLKNGSVLSHSAATTTETYKLDVTASSVNIDSSSKIDVSSKGYLGGWRGGNSTGSGMTYGNTTTGGSAFYSGGSYGGLGGYSSGNVNAAYGDMQQPDEVGSGGGTPNGGTYPGGNGGGFIKVTAGTVVLDGALIADGGAVTAAGGGSGGGVLLNLGSLSGVGTISARGGSAPISTDYGSGGGGRIAIYYDANTLPMANVIASGGRSGNGSVTGRNGGVGTIYLKDNVNPTRFGDCDADGAVSISEVQSAIGSLLGVSPASSCADLNGDGSVDISELQKAINGFLGL